MIVLFVLCMRRNPLGGRTWLRDFAARLGAGGDHRDVTHPSKRLDRIFLSLPPLCYW